MLRFNPNRLGYSGFTAVFQYILCCGSTMLKVNLDVCVIYFNTSYVAVQLVIITPRMFLFRDFNTSYVAVQLFFLVIRVGTKLSFQYILCCGSTKPSIPSNILCCYFNTSYVAVQLSGHFLFYI